MHYPTGESTTAVPILVDGIALRQRGGVHRGRARLLPSGAPGLARHVTAVGATLCAMLIVIWLAAFR